MNKAAPSPSRIAAMLIFALTCFGLLLFLWRAFGGAVPLAPEGYRFHARFKEATQLTTQGDVRISGVPVGKVVRIQEAPGRTDATIELKARYAPLASDSRAILRTKTLLGETYVELTPGSRTAPKIPEGGYLRDAQVAETVELDEVLRVFDPQSRAALQRWMRTWAGSLKDRGGDINAIVGNLAPTATDATGLLDVLDTQEGAVRRLVRDGGRTFAAVGARDADIGRLIRASDDVLATTAQRNRQLAEVVRILPTFLAELRPTMSEAQRTAQVAGPVVSELRPVAPLVQPTLRDVGAAAPDVRALLRDVDPLIRASEDGFPAADRLIRAAGPLVDQLHPLGRDLVPVARYLDPYKKDLTQAFANLASATNSSLPNASGRRLSYVRLSAHIHNETLGVASKREPSNRFNPYPKPGAVAKMQNGGVMESFSCAQARTGYKIGPILGTPPPCITQGPNPVLGGSTDFPRLERDTP